jgi:hypothetical protein
MPRKPASRQCPRCGRWQNGGNKECEECHTPLVYRHPWRMTGKKAQGVHKLALGPKGLTKEELDFRVRGVGASSTTKLTRAQYHELMKGLRALPNVRR